MSKDQRNVKETFQPAAVNLTTYTEEEIGIFGSFQAHIKCGENNEMYPVLVIKGKDLNLMVQDNLGSSKSILGKFMMLCLLRSIASGMT